MEKLKGLKGTYDILPDEVYKWQYIEERVRDICEKFGYSEIRIPVFEYTDLYARGVGGTTDIVQKEMYTFLDKGERSLTLRPEGTAGVVRSVLEHSLLASALPIKLYYLITCYRNEKPQAGRFREFRQFGIEAFGAIDPAIDAEIISLALRLLETLGLCEFKLNINSIGCPKCRAEYNKELMEYLSNHLETLCYTCNTRYDKNPLRIIDCKEKGCKEIAARAPKLLTHICDECRTHFEGLKSNLDVMGIKYNIDLDIVRGLDYYTKTVFEIKSNSLGAQSTICGGGRYDGLVEELGGNPTPGIGFGLGLERLILCLEAGGVSLTTKKTPEIFVATLGERAKAYAPGLINRLRRANIVAEMDYMGRGLKAQMKYADKLGAKYSVVIGDNELDSEKVILKNMIEGGQIEVSLLNIIQAIAKEG